MTMQFNSITYYYVVNLQGDVIAILDAEGNAVVTYTYDAWGNPTGGTRSSTDPNANALYQYNPLRYRGYVYDFETGFYYLQSRYYNPQTGRFLNADSILSTGQGFIGNNNFAYCLNNPINFVDRNGRNTDVLEWWIATMWVLPVVDLQLPVGEIVYAAGIGVCLVLTAVTCTGSTASTIPQDNVNASKNNSAATQSGATNAGTAGGAASPPPPDKNKNYLSFSKEYSGKTLYNKGGVRVDYEYNGNGTGNVHLQIKNGKYYYHKQGYLTTVLNDPNSAAPPHIQKLLHSKEIMKAILKGVYYIQSLGGHI